MELCIENEKLLSVINIDNFEYHNDNLIIIINNLCNININISFIKYYYDAVKDFNNSIKYYSNNDVKYDDDVKKYYNMIIKYFIIAINNYNITIKYYLNSIKKDYSDASIIYYDNAVKYYLMGIEKGYLNIINTVGYYYNVVKDYDNAIKYYLLAIDKGNYNLINKLDTIFINNINLYINTILNTNYKPNNIKLIFIKNNLIINKSYECPICYDDVNNSIKSICGHLYCSECFLKLDICAICRSNII
jgi:hypothetical protein